MELATEKNGVIGGLDLPLTRQSTQKTAAIGNQMGNHLKTV